MAAKKTTKKTTAKVPAKAAAKRASAERGFTDAEVQRLWGAAKGSKLMATRMQQYERHVTRIRTLERVLDPKDENALGNPKNTASYEAELERRKGELASLSRTLRMTLTREN